MPDVVMHYSSPTPDRMIFRDELAALEDRHDGLTVHRLHTDIDGMLDLADLDSICPDWRDRETWACGPGPMLDAISSYYEDADLEDRLHLERFSLQLGGEGGEGGTITFRNSGKTIEADGATTCLEAGEEAGIGMPFGCRMGICHTCTLTLVSGTVRDLRNGDEYGPAQRTGADLRHRRRRRLHLRHLTEGVEMAIADVKEYTHLTEEEVEQIGRELDAIRAEIEESRGASDAAYINRMIKIQRGLAAAGRATLFASQQEAGAGRPAPRCSGWPRSSRTWRSATTSCTASGTG